MCAAAAYAAQGRPAYRLPKGWQVRSEDKSGVYAASGRSAIFIKRGSDKDAAKLAPELFGGQPRPGNANIKVSVVSVQGAKAKKLVRRFDRYSGGGESGVRESIYEEIVVVPSAKKGQAWTLDFQAPRGEYNTKPQGGLADWQAFLRSFKPI